MRMLNRAMAILVCAALVGQLSMTSCFAEEPAQQKITTNPVKVELDFVQPVPVAKEEKVSTWVWWTLAGLAVVGGAAAAAGGGGGGGGGGATLPTTTGNTTTATVTW